jgi:hypothetical protein
MLGPAPGDLFYPLLLTKLVSPLFYMLAYISNYRVLVRLACVSLEPPLYIYASGCVHHAY